ncbi:tRNA pseudouridine(55) synthase TruB [Anaerosinus gibii]|uniref:tRNA pseudouridine synthase B n=1 Tax=Selenobaculum gibii TaxID=3054208 RepID=A0A9Y2AKG1_9FIRM|nr:tRNA pseudouridine(55) synthase TruB [Selenobaculum gbiensis]WIW71894.1 tRNA pseudouridine(55) synthase TruB [Selenobaculum gbiensis]
MEQQMCSDGLVNVLKPPGMSSHDVVSFIRRVYQTKKVGHAGTLDPAACGVLPIAIGKATRLIEYMSEADKSYRAELTFGFETDSGDDTGIIVKKVDKYILPSFEVISDTLNSFVGDIIQTPPMHSAIKINGNKLCDLVRKGIKVEVPSRKVEIKKILPIQYRNNKLLFDVSCSKGTYIRSLCMDIGHKLMIPATMSFLTRTRVGDFSLNDSYTLNEIAEQKKSILLDVDYSVKHLPSINLSLKQILDFQEGRSVKIDLINKAQLFRVYNMDKSFIGIARYDNLSGTLTAKKVLVRKSL